MIYIPVCKQKHSNQGKGRLHRFTGYRSLTHPKAKGFSEQPYITLGCLIPHSCPNHYRKVEMISLSEADWITWLFLNGLKTNMPLLKFLKEISRSWSHFMHPNNLHTFCVLPNRPPWLWLMVSFPPLQATPSLQDKSQTWHFLLISSSLLPFGLVFPDLLSTISLWNDFVSSTFLLSQSSSMAPNKPNQE